MIDTVALRIKTLKQAMSGKLSEQKSEDGEAIPEGIVVSDSSADENAYAIPTSWRWVRVKDVVAKDVGGGTPSKAVREYWNNGEISWATVKDFSNSENGYINETIDHITQEGLENSSANMVDEEAIVVCMRMALGKIARVAKPMAINQDLRALWLKSFVEQDYFVCFYKTLKVEGRGTTVAGIKKDELMNYAFPVPPVKEQRRIIEKVNSIFEQLDIIDDLQLQYASDLEVLKLKIIDAGIQGKLTKQLPEDGTAEELLEQIAEEKKQLVKEKKIKATKALSEITEDEMPFEIPSNWKWVRWGALSQSIQYGYNAPAKSEGRIKMVRISDIQDGKVLWDTVPYCDIEENEIASYLLHENDILFARTGGTVGKSYIVTEIPEECVFAGYLIRTSYSSKLYARYMKYFMESKLYWRQLQNGTIATAQPNCNGQTLSKMILPLPPYAEQVRIVEKINDAMAAVENM